MLRKASEARRLSYQRSYRKHRTRILAKIHHKHATQREAGLVVDTSSVLYNCAVIGLDELDYLFQGVR